MTFDEELGKEVVTEMYIGLQNIRGVREWLDEKGIDHNDTEISYVDGYTGHRSVFQYRDTTYEVSCNIIPDKLIGKPETLYVYDSGKDAFSDYEDYKEFIAELK